MRWISIFYLIFIFLSEPSFLNAQESPVAPEGSELAGMIRDDSLMVLEWAIFSNDKPEKEVELLFRKAALLLEDRKYPESLKTLDRISIRGLGDSLKFVLMYKKLLVNYLGGDFQQAQSEWKQLEHAFPLRSGERMPRLLAILTLNELGEWEQAGRLARDWTVRNFPEGPAKSQVLAQLEDRYSEKGLPRLKNLNRAVWFSRFIPGSGQAYAGYPAEGALNFAFNALSLGGGALMIFQGYWLTGYIAGFGLLQKFYFGGLIRTQKMVSGVNGKRKEEFNRGIRDLLMNEPVR